jgi:hypothetical protein
LRCLILKVKLKNMSTSNKQKPNSNPSAGSAKLPVSCRACKWWEKVQKPDEDYIEWTDAEHIGKCTRIVHGGYENDIARAKDDNSFMAGTFDGEDYKSGLLTGAEFGCILFGRHGS